MKMKAVDTLHVSSVGPDMIRAGQEFEVSDTEGKVLEERGLAKSVGGRKAEAVPENKAEAAPENKAERAPLSAATAPTATKRKPGRPAKK